MDLYCERLAPGLLGEPLNAATNVGFLVAAVWAWRAAGQRNDLRLLAALLAAIGFGSGLFHTFATPLAQLCDVIPIALLQLLYLHLYLRRVVSLRWQTTAACLGPVDLSGKRKEGGMKGPVILGSLQHQD